MAKKGTELYDDSWMYILLLTTLAILTESLKTYTFKISGLAISFAIILLPFSYLLVNYITKKYDYKKAVAAISMSAVITICFMALISFALGKDLILTNLAGEFFAYVISQFINLTIYSFLLNNTTSPSILVFITYLFSIIIFIMIYTLVNLDKMVLDEYWTKYFVTIVLDFIICIPVTIIDKNIKRGRDIGSMSSSVGGTKN